MKPAFDLQSLVDSHEQPFVVIDQDFRIRAVNRAYEQAYHTRAGEVIGKRCHEVSHSQDRPCFERGEDCPYVHVYKDRLAHSCLHAHQDKDGRQHCVRVTVYPLIASDGELYLGESYREISVQDDAAGPRVSARLVGEAPVFLAMLEQLDLVARSDMPALLLGETGTGKELAAKFIHQHSGRASGPFLTVDCTVLNETLADNELFGHERGAFTGSVGDKRGLVELADGGTLFLDEMGELPAAIQAKLLRVLESGEYRRVGGHQLRRVDVRVVCATNRHLWEAVQARHFREDLYYRIACLTVHLPSLRERRQDVPVLAGHILDLHYRATGRRYHVTQAALRLLAEQRYPGNVRELRNVLCAAAAHSRDGQIGPSHISRVLSRPSDSTDCASASPAAVGVENSVAHAALPRSMGSLESQHIAAMLREMGGNKRHAAEILGISTRTLYRKIKQFGLA